MHTLRASGGMVDALVLGTSEAIRGGSSPFLPSVCAYHARRLKSLYAAANGSDESWRNDTHPGYGEHWLPIDCFGFFCGPARGGCALYFWLAWVAMVWLSH